MTNVIEITDSKIQRVWICEFCRNHNLLNIEEIEFPNSDDQLYILESEN